MSLAIQSIKATPFNQSQLASSKNQINLNNVKEKNDISFTENKPLSNFTLNAVGFLMYGAAILTVMSAKSLIDDYVPVSSGIKNLLTLSFAFLAGVVLNRTFSSFCRRRG